MKNKLRIKVIKKNAVKLNETPVVIKKASKQEVKRETVEVVSDWINEFRQRRQEKTRTFDHFFTQS